MRALRPMPVKKTSSSRSRVWVSKLTSATPASCSAKKPSATRRPPVTGSGMLKRRRSGTRSLIASPKR